METIIQYSIDKDIVNGKTVYCLWDGDSTDEFDTYEEAVERLIQYLKAGL